MTEELNAEIHQVTCIANQEQCSVVCPTCCLPQSLSQLHEHSRCTGAIGSTPPVVGVDRPRGWDCLCSFSRPPTLSSFEGGWNGAATHGVSHTLWQVMCGAVRLPWRTRPCWAPLWIRSTSRSTHTGCWRQWVGYNSWRLPRGGAGIALPLIKYLSI